MADQRRKHIVQLTNYLPNHRAAAKRLLGKLARRRAEREAMRLAVVEGS